MRTTQPLSSPRKRGSRLDSRVSTTLDSRFRGNDEGVGTKNMQSEKLQKVAAGLGLGSRRLLEEWIQAGRFSINGVRAKIGDRVSPVDHILLDGRPLRTRDLREKKSEAQVLIYHKPVGELCSRSDPEGRPTVFDKLPVMRTKRWISVGRLDFNTSGLLLFTTDGDLANRLMHPSSNIEREYAVRILGPCTPSVLNLLQKGVRLEDGMARFESIRDAGGQGSNHWYHVTVAEGRNRIVRRLFESQNLKVSRLMRVRFGAMDLPRLLKPGQYRVLQKAELANFLLPLREKVGRSPG